MVIHLSVYPIPNTYGAWDSAGTSLLTDHEARKHGIHKTTADCWCQPRKEAYGDQHTYDGKPEPED